jgi:multisubunit Na+/H+ antiporter MnhB subunit
MDLDELKQRWRQEAGDETHVALDAGRVSGWIEARARAANREVRSRLRREAATYVLMLLALSVMMLMQGINGPHLALVAGLNLAVGAIVATLWYSERRLASLPLDRSVRQVLNDLLIRVERASRAYEMAYVGFIACAMASIGVTAWWQTRSGVWLTLTILGGALAVLWARWSGRAYVNRMFGPSRAELADCLRELERL